ncbi:MAG: isocitrate/isopropylmalate dehydrogenase family protein [Halodesulfurarchaeum sp.]
MIYDIAVIPGDGIGPHVLAETIPLLETVAERHEFEIDTTTYEWGSTRYLEEGAMMPEDGLERLEAHDAILLGAIGHPDVADHITLNGLLLPIRKGFNQQVCSRPSTLFPGIESPLSGYEGGEIDFVVFRENTEGEYANVGGREHVGFDHEVAIQSSVFTREGTEAIARAAFERATEREGTVTSITKSNAQAHSMVFWDDVIGDVAEEYPDVTVESLLVDAASMDLIRRPHEFDVIVASNLFGDILTDIGAIITGSMGLAPSASINVDGQYPSMFEPVHGSAPDIAGEGIANPLATVLSSSLMLDHLGESEAADDLWETVGEQLADGSAPRTADIGGDSNTADVVEDLRRRLT